MNLIAVDHMPEREAFPGFFGRFIRSERMTFVYWRIPAGTPLPEHAHPHEQVAHGLDGQFEFVIGGEKQVLGPGCVAIVPPNVPHSGRALTDCSILDVFSPIREDYPSDGPGGQ